MVTENLKHLLASVLQSTSAYKAVTKMRDVNGVEIFANGAFTFPQSRTEAFTLTATAAGISVGSGSTAETELDYQLETPITSGLNVSVTAKSLSTDTNGNPFLTYNLTITNTSSETITITEIGYKQTVNAANRPNSSTNSTYVVLLDRTVIDSPITIPPSDAAIIVYALRTVVDPPRTVSGVTVASFSSGTDEQIAAILDAAIAGTIDLQADMGWRVGDMRTIHMDAWTGENNVVHAEQDIDIVISSFEEYNGCGNVMQFDFRDAPTGAQRMNSTNTTTGGYAACLMYSVNLPAMYEALPSWLKSRMKTFDVVALGSTDSVATDNKLALRSATEIFGTTSPLEGSQIDLYKISSYRIKTLGKGGSANYWWLRSVYSSANFYRVNDAGTLNNSGAGNTSGVAPFGCI